MPRYLIMVEDTNFGRGLPGVAVKAFPSPWDVVAPNQGPPDSEAGHLLDSVQDVVMGWLHRNGPRLGAGPGPNCEPQSPGAGAADTQARIASPVGGGAPHLRLVGADDEPLDGGQA